MRRTGSIVLVLCAVLTIGCASTNWFLYKNHNAGFQIDYPSQWSIVYEDKDRGVLNVSSISLEKYAHGGIPPAGTMEVLVVKGICVEPSDEFLRVYLVEDGKGPSFLRKRACLNGYRITLDIWETDLDKNKQKLLEKILKSFRTTD